MTKTLEENQAFVKALYKVVDDRGEDYNYLQHYEDCKYIIDGKAACLIGAALVEAGHTHEEILSWENCIAISGPNGENAATKMLRMGYDENIAWAARHAQLVQDQGGTWGEAEQSFIDYLVEKNVWLKFDPPVKLCNGF